MDPFQSLIDQGLQAQREFIEDQQGMDFAFREGKPIMDVLRPEDKGDEDDNTSGTKSPGRPTG